MIYELNDFITRYDRQIAMAALAQSINIEQ